MLQYPHINPIALQLGPLKVHWYGIMYLIGFLSAWLLGLYRAKKPFSAIEPNHVADAIFYGALGVILGGRTGYMFFYNLPNFIHQPWIFFQVWDGGMSFHGGFIGVGLALWLYARKIDVNPFDLYDFFIPMVPIGLAAGRIGNFINGELWGRVTHSYIGMVFPTGGPLPRFPSQLIECALEGITLFCIVWFSTIKPKQRFFTLGLFCFFYGIFRFIAEFFREPDPQLGYLLWHLVTMGQVLSLPMIIGGLALLIYLKKKSPKTYNPKASFYLQQQRIKAKKNNA